MCNTAASAETKPTLADLKDMVAVFLMGWAALEERLQGQSVPVELVETKKVRNLLCHGLKSFRSDPYDEHPAFVTCRLHDGSEVRITAQDLAEAIHSLR